MLNTSPCPSCGKKNDRARGRLKSVGPTGFGPMRLFGECSNCGATLTRKPNSSQGWSLAKDERRLAA